MVSVACSPRWPGLGSVQGFVVDKVALVGQVSLRILQFPLVRVISSMIDRHIFRHPPYANCMLILVIPQLKSPVLAAFDQNLQSSQ